MNKLIVRHDDFDFRMKDDSYINIHEKFIEKNLIETAVIQFTQYGKLQNFKGRKKLIDYMNSAPNWDFQLHGWQHRPYASAPSDEIIEELAASLYFFDKLFGKQPTIWYPPYNEVSPEMVMIAKEFGLEVVIGRMGILEYVKGEGNTSSDITNIHFHGWADHEMKYFDRMLNLLEKRGDR